MPGASERSDPPSGETDCRWRTDFLRAFWQFWRVPDRRASDRSWYGTCCPSCQPAVVKEPVRFTVSWSVAPAEARPISRALHALLSSARSEPGWLHGSLHTTLSDCARLTYREDWQTENDLRRAVRSPRFDQLLELMDRASREPKLRVQLPSAVRGLDYIVELRGSRRP